MTPDPPTTMPPSRKLSRAGAIGAAREHLIGKRCWHAGSGGSAGSTFVLDLGDRVPREHELRGRQHSQEFRRFQGEVSVEVWCDWRLESRARVISGSDDAEPGYTAALDRLVGRRVTDLHVATPGLDMTLQFSSGLTLLIFCNHLGPQPTMSSNWGVFLRTPGHYVGCEAGSRLCVEPL